jgi:hypothetical protein
MYIIRCKRKNKIERRNYFCGLSRNGMQTKGITGETKQGCDNRVIIVL